MLTDLRWTQLTSLAVPTERRTNSPGASASRLDHLVVGLRHLLAAGDHHSVEDPDVVVFGTGCQPLGGWYHARVDTEETLHNSIQGRLLVQFAKNSVDWVFGVVDAAAGQCPMTCGRMVDE